MKNINRSIRRKRSDISTSLCVHLFRGHTAEEATGDIVNVQIPELDRPMKAGELKVDNIDVFCEQGVFNVDQTRRILVAGQQIGLAANFHGEELHCLHSAEVVHAQTTIFFS